MRISSTGREQRLPVIANYGRSLRNHKLYSYIANASATRTPRRNDVIIKRGLVPCVVTGDTRQRTRHHG